MMQSTLESRYPAHNLTLETSLHADMVAFIEAERIFTLALRFTLSKVLADRRVVFAFNLKLQKVSANVLKD